MRRCVGCACGQTSAVESGSGQTRERGGGAGDSLASALHAIDDESLSDLEGACSTNTWLRSGIVVSASGCGHLRVNPSVGDGATSDSASGWLVPELSLEVSVLLVIETDKGGSGACSSGSRGGWKGAIGAIAAGNSEAASGGREGGISVADQSTEALLARLEEVRGSLSNGNTSVRAAGGCRGGSAVGGCGTIDTSVCIANASCASGVGGGHDVTNVVHLSVEVAANGLGWGRRQSGASGGGQSGCCVDDGSALKETSSAEVG